MYVGGHFLLSGGVTFIRMNSQHVAELFASDVQRVSIAAGDGDTGAFMKEAAGRLEADAAAAAGDERALVLQSAHFSLRQESREKQLDGTKVATSRRRLTVPRVSPKTHQSMVLSSDSWPIQGALF